nr:MAG TPA: hypothetical protein [Caudoviricetes sp.]
MLIGVKYSNITIQFSLTNKIRKFRSARTFFNT